MLPAIVRKRKFLLLILLLPLLVIAGLAWVVRAQEGAPDTTLPQPPEPPASEDIDAPDSSLTGAATARQVPGYAPCTTGDAGHAGAASQLPDEEGDGDPPPQVSELGCEPIFISIAAYAELRNEPVTDHWDDDPSLEECSSYPDDPGFETEAEAETVLEAEGDELPTCEVGPGDIVIKVYVLAADSEAFVKANGCGASLEEAC